MNELYASTFTMRSYFVSGTPIELVQVFDDVQDECRHAFWFDSDVPVEVVRTIISLVSLDFHLRYKCESRPVEVVREWNEYDLLFLLNRSTGE